MPQVKQQNLKYIKDTRMHKKSIFLLFAALLLSACNQKNDRHAKAEKIVAEWLGKTIQLPANMRLTISGKDTVMPKFHSTKYKILFFSDSTGCASCKLNLFEWQKLIAETDSTLTGKLSFIFCFQPRNRDDLISLLRSERFIQPVFIDKTNEMNNLNHFPENETYQCFLLDSINKVMAVGNPIRNPKVWDLYKQIITGISNNHDKGNTLVEVKSSEVELGEI